MVAVPYPDMSLQVALNANPNSNDNPRWTDITELAMQAEGINRGHPYQQPTGQASTPRVTIRDPQELFNVLNTVDSPFVNGLGGRNVQPYRAICWQCMHPRGTTGNLWNLSNWRVPIDPSFDSYAVGSTPSFLKFFGNAPTITASNPLQGTQSLTMGVNGGGQVQAVQVPMAVIPGRYYIVQVIINQGAANTVAIWISGHPDLATTTAVATTTKLSGVFYADQPQLFFNVGIHAAGTASALTIDAIMYEPTYPVNPVANFNGQNGGAGSTLGFAPTFASVGLGGKAAGGFHLNTLAVTGTGAGNPKAEGLKFAVQPNTQYAQAGALTCGAGGPTTRKVTNFFYTSGGAFISGNQSPDLNLTSGGEWVHLDPLPIITSPATAAFASCATESNSASTVPWYADHLDLVPATPSAFTTTGPVIYPILRDYVERWPRRWDSAGFEGFADLQLVDGFGALASAKLHTEYAAAVMATNPAYYWRLNEPAGATSYADSAGSGVALQRFDGPFGPAPTFSLGASLNIAGDPGSGGLSVDTGPSAGNVPSTVAQAGAFNQAPGIALGGNSPLAYSVAFWLARNTDRILGGAAQYIFGMAAADNSNNFLAWCQDGSPNQLFISAVWPPNGFGQLQVTDTWADGVPHLYVITVTATSGSVGSATFYIDGVNLGSFGSGTFTGSLTFSWIQIAGFMARFHNNIPGAAVPAGVYSGFALWNRVLAAGEVADLVAAGKGYPGELPGVRIPRHLTRGNYLSGTNNIPPNRISTGRSTLGPSSGTERIPALSDLQNITLSEAGTLWIAPDGALVFESRDDRFLRVTPTTTFGEDIVNGECPYLPGVLYDLDPMFAYSDVKITQTQGVIATGGRTADINAANAQFFARSYTSPGTVDMLSSAMVQDYADWVFYTHNSPQARIEAITVDPMSNPALWPFVLNVEIGQRVRVRRRPRGLTGNLVIDQQYFVEQVLHGAINFDSSNGRPLSWRTSVVLSPASTLFQPWLLDDGRFGLGNNTRLGF